jgi:hypothetical protein
LPGELLRPPEERGIEVDERPIEVKESESLHVPTLEDGSRVDVPFVIGVALRGGRSCGRKSHRQPVRLWYRIALTISRMS